MSAVFGLALAVPAVPAGAITGEEHGQLVIVASGESGSRVPLSSVLVARGVYTGVGRVVELENLPGDGDDVSRDDVLFPEGTWHLRNVNQDVTFSLDHRACAFTTHLTQLSYVEGGTGLFAKATGTFTATLTARGVTARNPDGSCALDRAPLIEVDRGSASSGSFTY